ncbi:YgiT-type zinc finger protein [Streptomyces sp. NPDC005017]|uniref:YgiT-type zinc finger protein n=1 Tax=Streptomyces sp. NPDC005017 TaxID=3364706 RepID=UPI0036D19E66
MGSLAEHDLGKCPCGGSYYLRNVVVRMTVNGRIVVLDDISQGSCPNCGSRVYKALTLEAVENVMRGGSMLSKRTLPG